MPLAGFIRSCPDGLRLGQYFYNCYLSKLKPEDTMHKRTQLLYNTPYSHVATGIIKEIMDEYQWETLPYSEWSKQV